MLRNNVVLLIIIVGFLADVNGHSYHMGSCPNVDSVQNFDMQKFLGLWYAVEKTNTKSSCFTYNLTVASPPSQYLVKQTYRNKILQTLLDQKNYTYIGKVYVPDYLDPGHMTVKFPLNIFGTSSFTVFSTDYTNYAGIFTCQKLALFHRRSVTFLSRSTHISEALKRQMTTQLGMYGIDTNNMDEIDHENCQEVSSYHATSGSIVQDDDYDVDRPSSGSGRKIAGEAEWVRF